MSDLFSASGMADEAPRPLADRLRPKSLSEVVGQDHLLGPDGALGRMLATKRLSSIIFWGPPGVGKTTIARLLAKETDLEFEAISAVFSGVKDLRAAFDRAPVRKPLHLAGGGRPGRADLLAHDLGIAALGQIFADRNRGGKHPVIAAIGVPDAHEYVARDITLQRNDLIGF